MPSTIELRAYDYDKRSEDDEIGYAVLDLTVSNSATEWTKTSWVTIRERGVKARRR